ncbi:MAG: transcriptional repressor [Agarilytica sp.]
MIEPSTSLVQQNAAIEKSLQSAKRICEKQGVRLTPLRKQVLTILLEHSKPRGAYQLMDLLEQCSERERVAPPTVYRALDFLLEHRLIHKIHSLNAFVANANPLRQDSSVILICVVCGAAEEVPNNSIQQAINLSASQHRFSVEKQVIELSGKCAGCRDALRDATANKK